MSRLKSFLDSANTASTDFPLENLPYGVFRPEGGAPRVGVALGDSIVDLGALAQAGLLTSAPASVFQRADVNAFMALGRPVWRETRAQLQRLFGADAFELRDKPQVLDHVLHAQTQCTLLLPIACRGYTDFYASKEHATNVGTMFRDPKNALLPNWVHIPIGYNGRASTVVVSGTPIRRPLGQLKPPNAEAPVFAPCKKLDFELELGAIVGTPSAMGEGMSLAQAEEAIFGYVLLNDWSARDIQTWEYVPLGPFQAKVFATTISPWIVTSDALAAFAADGPAQEPEPLAYLRQSEPRNFDIQLEVEMQPVGRPAKTISRTNYKYMYWSSAQQLAHHASGGCAMEVGDLLGSGTISGPTKDLLGSLLELTWNGAIPIDFGEGVTRAFIEDGDDVILRGWCQASDYRIGFGAATGVILPARDV